MPSRPPANVESEVPLRHWSASPAPKAAVQIVHGLAEHSGRYAQLAADLNRAGYTVYAHDHPGHGPSAAYLGFFAPQKGWQKCLDAIRGVQKRIAQENPGLPIFLLAHSMGSLMTQQLISEGAAENLAGVILSGTDGPPSLLARAGRVVARLERIRLGPHGRSRLIHHLAFGGYNKPFAPARTPYDWLSRDPAAVDAYLADPNCGFVATTQLWIDLLDALGGLTDPARLARIPRDLPIHLITGARDSVSANGRGVQKLLKLYQHAGLQQVTARFYPEARHELFHETNRSEVVQDLIAWLDQTVAERKFSGPTHAA